MRIAGKETVVRWQNLRDRLQAAPTRQLWASAYRRFYRRRIDTRYLEPIASIERHDRQLGEGFSTVALFCTLVEYLESCERGDNFRYVGRSKTPLAAHEYSERQATTYFKDFLRSRPPFSALVPPGLVDSFYQDVRCGLLHEARTKGGWILSSKASQGQLVLQHGNQITLFRRQLVPAVEAYLSDYRSRLLTDANTQAAFIRKFNYLASP